MEGDLRTRKDGRGTGRVVRRAGVALLVALVLLVVYGVAVEPRFLLDRTDLRAEVPGLAEQDAGTRAVFLSDLQVGMWWANTGMVRKAVAEAVEADPDLVLLGGDYVYSTDPDVGTQVDTVLELLRPLLRAGVPVYAVMGNHDHSVGAVGELETALTAAGAQVLTNDAAVVPGTGGEGSADDAQALRVVGLGAVRPDMVDVEAALSGVPEEAPRIVLMHNPTAFPELPAGTAPFAVAGHTHCGQVALPGTPHWSYLGLTEEESLVADGWAFDDYGAEANDLFVSCGIGFSAVPVRINARPELVVVDLQP